MCCNSNMKAPSVIFTISTQCFLMPFVFSRESGFFRVIKGNTLPQIAMFLGLCDATELSVNEHVFGL